MKKYLLLLLAFIPTICFAHERTIINVENTDEALKKIDEIYNDLDIGYYSIDFDNNTVDINRVNESYKEKYITDISINTYKYEDYAYYQPIRFLPIINENSIYIDNMNKKITKEETEQLDKFADKFIKLFAGKTDYEKIYMAYVYISRNAVYQSDGAFENLVDGYISAYDVLINNKTVCIGSATAFSYLMDKLGIESYIVDHIASYDAKNRIYYSSHTYNVVKLDGKYYIVDIKYNNDLSGLLISNQNYKDEKYNYNILISDEDYPREDFDYTFNENDINNLENEVKEETKLESNESIYYIILVLILLVIGLIIFIFTRRKK